MFCCQQDWRAIEEHKRDKIKFLETEQDCRLIQNNESVPVKCNLILLFSFQDFYTDMKFKTFRNGESLLFY